MVSGIALLTERVFETVLPVFDPLHLAPASRRGFFLSYVISRFGRRAKKVEWLGKMTIILRRYARIAGCR